MEKNKKSNRLKRWLLFDDPVQQHIEQYTVPQYGDYPDDQLSEFTLRDYANNMRRYVNRIQSGQRGKEEELRDCLKLAHYACELWHYKRKESSNK